MKNVLIIGSGISGLSCAIRCAEQGMHAVLASPYPSERAQSVMAQGGINAVTGDCEEGDSVACHVEDTLKGGGFLAGRRAVEGLCGHGEEILRYLESIGTVLTLDENGRPARRAFGGQSHKRTFFSGASTGKQIVSSLVMECRKYEAEGLITRRRGCFFHSALIREGICRGALLFDEKTRRLETVISDATVLATGGQNTLFGKTTGSTQCDGYAAGRLFMQGAVLKNLEFIQFHPTTLETSNKRMLITEAVRGEGGRLFYEEDGRRVYFMEDKYGPRGNLMTRDLISREMAGTGREIFLDISFLGTKKIRHKLLEAAEVCEKFRGIDITREPIPVAPSVHFFMGGLAVGLNHETSIRNLFAVGECASIYHGANRLGGNSLLAALYSGRRAAEDIGSREASGEIPDFTAEYEREWKALQAKLNTESPFPAVYIRDLLADTVRKHLWILREEQGLREGLADIDSLLEAAESIRYDSSVLPYENYSLTGVLTLARAALTCALSRRESRGAHYRTDYPETDQEQQYATLISFDGGAYRTWLDKEHAYED